MGCLPKARVLPARPFFRVGSDFAGPFMIRATPGRGYKAYKGYVCVFVCLATKAAHLEVVSDLSTAAFLVSFKRFVSRRGTNFQGAKAEIRRLFAPTSTTSSEIAASIAKNGIYWAFIPPQAPTFGGLWEACVRSFKTHLKRIIGDLTLTFEEFSTVTCMIEACLNSRFLRANSSDAQDLSALTPGHFLIGASLIFLPEPYSEEEESVKSLRSRWLMLGLIRNHFWKRWKAEVLAFMQQRTKWLKLNYQLEEESLVLFKDKLTPPTKWPLARIIQLHPGPDNLSRVATTQTATSVYKRPVNRLILLPTEDNKDEQNSAPDLLTAGGLTTSQEN